MAALLRQNVRVPWCQHVNRNTKSKSKFVISQNFGQFKLFCPENEAQFQTRGLSALVNQTHAPQRRLHQNQDRLGQAPNLRLNYRPNISYDLPLKNKSFQMQPYYSSAFIRRCFYHSLSSSFSQNRGFRSSSHCFKDDKDGDNPEDANNNRKDDSSGPSSEDIQEIVTNFNPVGAIATLSVPDFLPNIPAIAINRNPVFPRFVKMLEVSISV